MDVYGSLVKKHRISTEGSLEAFDSPFDGLSSEGLPTQLVPAPHPVSPLPSVRMRVGCLEPLVTVARRSLYCGISKDCLMGGSFLNALKRRCGTGGKLVGQEMEIQGDQRKFLEGYFEGHGFRVIWAGG